MPSITEALTIALQHHQAGRLQPAEQIYRQILQAEPNQPDANHLLGMIAHQGGRYEIAVELIGRAIAVKGEVAEYHCNLANVYHAWRRYPEAIACCRRALELKSELAEAHNNLGLALKEEGNLDEAVACYRRALELRPDFAEAHNNLGLALTAQHKLAEAAGCFGEALRLQPNFAEAHNNLGNAFQEQGKLEDAVACCSRAVELAPTLAEAHYNLSVALRERGKLDSALACCRRAIELQPDFAQAYNNLAAVFYDQGRIEDAIASYRRALELQPGFVKARLNLAVALLTIGCDEEGWSQYESRLGLSPERPFSAPRWKGERAEGKMLLVHCEQGFGDTLQFLRYLTFVRERAEAGRMIVACQPKLARLLTHNFGGEMEIATTGGGGQGAVDARPGIDWHLPLLSAPWALGMVEPLTISGPYLHADSALRASWRERLGSAAGLRVGLAWQGNPAQARDRGRSIAAERFLPLLKTNGAAFYSLQLDGGSAAAATLAEAGLIDLTDEIDDFADTAAFIAELDLVITVDSAVAHLAGALGRPVWTLLRFVPHWPYGLRGKSTRWYSTMRLFRQPDLADWVAVLRQVSAELDVFARTFRAPRVI